jgi:NADPH2:quinone reductase
MIMINAILVREFGGPEVLKMEQKADLKPGQGEILMAVKAAGVNPVEALVRAGLYPMKPPLPYTPGKDAAGLVLEVGAGVTRFKVGDRVYNYGPSSGAYASQMIASESGLQFLPEKNSFAEGAALGVPYGTAHRALFVRAHAQAGETVLVHGASGGVGTAAIQLARAAGLKVFGTAGNSAARQAVLANGAHEVFDHTSTDYWEKIMTATQGKGVNIIIEMLANVNLAKDLLGLSMGGRVVVVGSRGSLEIDPRATMAKDLSILGMSNGNATEKEASSTHAAIHAGLENGSLKPLIAETLPLKEAARAHEQVMKNGKIGKIVLLPEA